MSQSYRFGQFVLDPGKRTLSRADSPVSLTPKAFDVLLFLAQNPNRLVTKEELLQAVWGDTVVEEGNLAQYVWHLRKALGDDSENPRLIVTIARKGYQFTMDVIAADAGAFAKDQAVQVSAESSHANTKSHIESRGGMATSKAPKPWAKAAFLVASPLILAAAAYASWRHFAGVTPPRPQRIMLAVLPFQNLTGDANQEYLADGLTEEMISQLGRLNPEQLGVIGRTSVMRYKHSDERLDQIGRDLSVQYILENSLRESGDHMRITAQLLQVKDQSQLWSRDYDYPAKDILNVEDDVAKAVASEIQLRLTPQQQTALSRPHPVNPEAFEAYMQGYYFYERNTNKDADMATQYYERATQLDPSYALAWVGLSRARYWQADKGLIPTEEGQRLARDADERALALDPNLPQAHAQMGRIKRQLDLDWAGADASIQRAISLEPGNPEYARSAAFMAAILGHFEEALKLARGAVDLDPLNAESWENLGETKFWAGHVDEAVADLKKALELSPDVWLSWNKLAQIHLMQGRPQDALREVDQVQWAALRMRMHAMAYHALGREKESDAALRELFEKLHSSAAFSIATVYAFRNQRNEAFLWLDRAYAQHDTGLITTKVEPLLNNLHGDPRFAALLKKLNFPN
jgi:TolB-like protein/DNA-binding winged helix-turn-helix (wHTH) protein/Tfp pilus assembly protein PilF